MIFAKSVSLSSASVFFAALALCACSARPPKPAPNVQAAAPQANDLAPPSLDTVRIGPRGVVLSGVTQPGVKVRLASPAGQEIFAAAGAEGRWSIDLPPAAEPRIFGLSATVGERRVQAQGYILVSPSGQAALLRAGAGALRIDPGVSPGLRAVDFDRGGGMEVSVAAPPGATVILRLDGRQVAEGRADGNGRYEASLGSPDPVQAGPHQIQIAGDGFTDQALVQVSPAAPLAQGPLRSQLTSAGLRVDWMTPGGGEQSTLIVH